VIEGRADQGLQQVRVLGNIQNGKKKREQIGERVATVLESRLEVRGEESREK